MTGRFVDDAVFGRLEFVSGYLWKKDTRLSLFGEEFAIPLYAYIPKNGELEENQRQAMRDYLGLGESVSILCEKALAQYCTDLQAEGQIAADLLVADAQHIQPTAIHFQFFCDEPTFGILFDSKWSPDSGVGLRFCSGEVVEKGTQDLLL